MELFDEKGCLTDGALKAAVSQEHLGELERLEISEHLSFCDGCLERYSDLLTDDILMTPEHPAADKVAARLCRKVERFLFHRVTAAVLAACFAIAFVFSDAFTMSLTGQQERLSIMNVSQRVAEEGELFSDKVSGMFSGLERLFARPAEKKAPLREEQKPSQRQGFDLFSLFKGAGVK